MNWGLFWVGASSVPMVIGMLAELAGVHSLMFLMDPVLGLRWPRRCAAVRFALLHQRLQDRDAAAPTWTARGLGHGRGLRAERGKHVFARGPVYYEAAAVVITLVLLGKNRAWRERKS